MSLPTPAPMRSAATCRRTPHHIRHPHARPGIQNPRPVPDFPSIKPSSRQKPQQSCMIKANQGIHENLLPTDSQPQPPSLPGIPPLRLCAFATLRLCVKNPVIKPQSRQKPLQSCLIKPHQGKRQIFQQPSVRPPTRWIGRTGHRMAKRVPRRNPLPGERKQVRASVIPNQSLFAPSHSPVCRYGLSFSLSVSRPRWMSDLVAEREQPSTWAISS